jgi:RNA polymerase sigma factor (sigma-70 family)
MTIAPLEPADALDDAELAVAAAGGNQLAFSTIYDRYADRLYDFCVGMLRDGDAAADCVQDVFVTAATKLVQLQDPNRLRAWLYAIARHEALARIRARRREVPSDELPETVSSEPDLATVAARNELATLIAEACGGLSDRDRTVYELAYRHGLDGPELADALGVSHTNANTLVGRLRDSIERSLGALLVCRRIKADPGACPELAVVLGNWDGTFTVLMRKRAARHIDGCSVCGAERRRMVNPAALLGSAPVLLPAPAWLRNDTLSDATLVRPDQGRHPNDGESWWPPREVDDREGSSPAWLSAAQARHLRTALIAALAVLGIAGLAQLIGPIDYRTEPVSTPGEPASTSTTSAATFGIAGISPSASTASEPAPVTTTATSEPALSLTPEPNTPTLTTVPSRTSTSRTAPNSTFAPSRHSSTRTPTTESEDEETTSSSTTTSTSTPSSSSSSTTTTTSDPIE